MANLDDVVAGLEMNAEYLDDIHGLQKEQFAVEQSTNNNIEQFVQILKDQQRAQTEQQRENSRSQGAAAGQSRGFKGAVAETAGAGLGSGLGMAAKGIGAGVGLAALGYGIGGFFSGLAAGAKGVDILNADTSSLKNLVIDLGEIFEVLSGEAFVGIGALLVAGAGFGALFGAGKSAKAAAGMTAIGLGIGGFFAGLAAGSAGVDIFNTDGESLKNLMVNLAEGMGAFAARDLTGLTALLAAGALFGQAPAAAGKAAIGMGLIGAGIGAFFTGIAGMSKVMELIGSDGSGIRDIMVNLGEGLAGLSSEAIDMSKLLLFGPAMASVAAGMLAITGSTLVNQLGSFVGSFFKDDNEPSVFERLASDLTKLSAVDLPKLEGFSVAVEPIFKLGSGLKMIAKVDMDDFEENIDKFNSLVAEGKITASASILTNTVVQKTMDTVGEQQGNVTVINNNTNAPTNTQNNISGGGSGGDISMPPATSFNGTRSDAYIGVQW